MAQAKKLYVVGSPALSPPDMTVLRRLRLRYYPTQAAIIGPHITFMFALDTEMWGELRPHLLAITRSQASVELVLRRVGTGTDMGNGKFLTYLLPHEGRDSLTALHRALHAGPFMRFINREQAYDPHVTLGSFPDMAGAQELAERLKGDGIAMTGRIVQLDTVLTDGESIVHYASMPLTG